MSYNIVNQAVNHASVSGGTIAFSLTIAAAASGHMLILGILCPTSSPVPSPSCTNVTWTSITTQVSQSTTVPCTMYMWYGIVSGGSSGTTITATSTGGSNGDGGLIQYFEVSGVTTTSPIDVTQSNNQASSATTSYTTTTSIATTNSASDIIFAWLTDVSSGPGITPVASFTNSFIGINTNNTGGPILLGSGFAYYVPGVQGSFATAEQFTSSLSITQYGQSIIVAMFSASNSQGINTNIIGTRRRIISYM